MSDLGPQTKQSAYFVRKTTAAVQQTPVLNIPGTKTSLQNSQLLTPIGIPSIDSFIGGGLPVGSVCLIGQDLNNHYSDVITRCFMAEGVSHKHSLYLADLVESSDSYFQRIPSINKIEESDASKEDEKLRIAWRYGQQQQTTPQSQQSTAKLQPNYFLMNKLMSKQDVQASSNIRSFESLDSTQETLYKSLAKDLTQHIDSLNLNVSKTKQYTNVMRIVINSVSGCIWNDQSLLNDENDSMTSLCQFLFYLRSLLRHSLAVCILTVPYDMSMNQFAKLTHLVDYSFILDDSNKATSGLTNTQYDGLFRIVKLPRLNSLNPCATPNTLDLAFHMKKKRLIVEELHLPPELGENDDQQKGRTSTSMSCSSTTNSKLDF